MKRAVCPQHTRYVGKGRSVIIDSTNCAFCKKESRVGPLKVAQAFREAAGELEFLVENPDYDPMGIALQHSATKAIKLYLRLIHPAYGKNLVNSLVEQSKETR